MAVASVGLRCYCDGFYGTVRFIGPVPPTSGEWVGVEWDDPTRGKHDGTSDGVRYFKCSKPGSGSFVREKKLHFGYSYQEALKKKYGEKPKDVDITIGESNTSMGKKVEMFGFDKQVQVLSQYSSLVTVDLRDTMLSSAGPTPGEVAAITPCATSLNLSKNQLLSSWKDVANITGQLTLLKELLLSENRLSICADKDLSPAFKGVTILYINKMAIQWRELSYALSLMPCLEELHVCENHISTLKPSDGSFSSLEGLRRSVTIFPHSLRLVNLEENHLSDWADILSLQHLPRLQSLVLNDNQLSSIHGLDECSFPVVHSLSLSRNKVSEWSALNNLIALKSLRNLRFQENPVHKDEQMFFTRQLTIARLPLVEVLNNSQITANERREAERYYIKRYIKEWLSAEEAGSTKEFLMLHPLYAQLLKVHGLPEEVVDSIKASNSSNSSVAALRNRLIAITVSCPDRADLPQLSKKLPDSMTVQKLKGLLQRVYKVDSSDQVLSYRSQKMSDAEIEINDDLKQLSFYSLESGDHILMRTL